MFCCVQKKFGIAISVLLLSMSTSLELEAANSSGEFRREVESLLGATVKTKQGIVQIRQKRDASGRVRRHFISGRNFSELQLDQNGDGNVDFLELTRDDKTVTVSQVYNGRFLRLVVSQRGPRGRIEGTYVLEPSGQKYALMYARLYTSDAVLNIEGELPPEFEATNVAPPAAIDVAATTASTNPEVGATTTIDLADDESWRTHQADTWGPDLTCVSDETAVGRLARFQREWWKALKYDYEANSAKLNERLSDAKIFDESCRKPGQEKNFKALTSALSEVMMSSSKGETFPTTVTRGRYLRCLEQSGLGQVAAKIEMHFLQNIDGGNGVQRPLQCDFRPGQAGIAKPAFMFPDTKHIKIQLAAADQGKSKPTAMGSEINYKNILFHELIHVAGVASEEMTHAAQACCGEPTENRSVACAKLDNLVIEERRYTELETFLARSGLMDPIYSDLYNKFDDPYTADLYRKYVLGLDAYRKNGQIEKGLLSDQEFENCLKADSEIACREKWSRHIADYTSEFFKKECRKHVPATKRKECLALGNNPAFHNQMATAVSRSVIRLSVDPVEPGTAPICGQAAYRIFDRSRQFAKAILSIFGISVASAQDEGKIDCEGTSGIQIGEPPVAVNPQPSPGSNGEVPPLVLAPLPSDLSGNVSTPGTGPRLVTPGQNDLDNATGGNSAPGGDRAVGNAPNRRPNRNTNLQPMPVTDVSSPGSARDVVDRTYRRATDVVGLTTRGLRNLGSNILPQAVAAEKVRQRRVLETGNADFVAFRPKLAEAKSMKVDNPFASGFSLVLPSSERSIPGQSAQSFAGTMASNLSTKSRTQDTEKSLESAGSAKNSSGKVSSALSAQRATSADTALNGSNNSSAAANGSVGANPRKPASVELMSLLRMKYREVEPRINELSVQQALIDGRIKIIRANGSVVGSKRNPNVCYKFVGYDKQMKSPCD